MAYIRNSLTERKCCKVKPKKNVGKPALWLGGLAVLFLFLLSVEKELRLAGGSMAQILKQTIATEFSNSLYQNFIPSFSFVQEKRSEGIWFADGQITNIMPLYGYTLEKRREEQKEDTLLYLEEIMLAEAQEGTVSLEEDGVAQGKAEDITGAVKQDTAAEAVAGAVEQEVSVEELSLEELLRVENEAALQARAAEALAAVEFIPHTVQAQVDLKELQDYETLINQFYTVDANTMAGSDQLEVNKLLSHDMTVKKGGEEPQILIYHTHSQENFADSVPGDVTTSIVGVGARLTELLTKQYGYQVLHHTGQYDVDSRDDAYSASLPAIEKLLAENPSIEVVIDLHRDQMAEETRLVMDLDGRPTARFMFFNGLSRTRKTGDISYLYNENLEENLAFSFQMKLKAEEYYPGLTRKNYLKGYRYNMHLRPKTLLIELGAQNNTVEEAMNACDPLAHILDMVLTGQ